MVAPLIPTRDDPLVDLGSDGPVTLSPGISVRGPAGEVSFVGQVPDYTDVPMTPQGVLAQKFDSRQMASSADRAMLNSAAALASGQTDVPPASGSSGGVTDVMDLQALLGGIQDDSAEMFARLQQAAGQRGQATADAIGALTGQVDSEMGRVGNVVGGDPGGGLSGDVLAGAGAAGAQGIRDVQAALGGFLQQSQGRRTNAWQNYLGGLQGQSQIAMDQARTLGEFMQQQNQQLIEQEQQRALNDIAANTAQQQMLQQMGLPVIPGMSFEDTIKLLPSDTRANLLFGQDPFADPSAGGAEGTVGPIEQVFRESGISEEVLPGMSQLELQAQREFEQMEGGFGMGDIERYIRDNTIVVPPGDKRLGRFVKVGQKSGEGLSQGQRLAVTAGDRDRYLQAAAAGLLDFGD